MGDTIRFKKGPKTELPSLGIGEPGFTTDPEDQRLYIGGIEGNIQIPNMTDIDAINSELSKHKYKSFYGFASIGVDDSTLSATDFASNVTSIYNTMITNSCCSLTAFVQNTNFTTSLSSKLSTDLGVSFAASSGFLIEIVCNAGINTPNKMFVYPNNSNRIFYIAIDNSVMATKELTTDDSGWINLPLVNNYTAASSALTPKYRKIGNIVRLDGRISGVTATAGTVSVTLASLPAGFRPFRLIKFLVANAGGGVGLYKITINTDGTVVLAGSSGDLTTSDHISLDGISFTVN